jgi:hypothetical protein
LRAFVHQREVVEHEEVREDLFRRQADGLQQDRHRHLAATVDAEVQDVLRVELEVQPRAAVRNDPGREQQLARAVGLARSCSKNTPGERCSCETMTRSVPLMTKEPCRS